MVQAPEVIVVCYETMTHLRRFLSFPPKKEEDILTKVIYFLLKLNLGLNICSGCGRIINIIIIIIIIIISSSSSSND